MKEATSQAVRHPGLPRPRSPLLPGVCQTARKRFDTRAMDTEMALGMSLDDIINQKKQKPLGSNKSKVSARDLAAALKSLHC